MEGYLESIKISRPKKREGQNFLIDKSIAEIEAKYAEGRKVLEMGAGMGILTEALCSVAKKVVAVEKDKGLFERLEYTMLHDNLTLINKDFFDLEPKELAKSEIMISNIPYKLSSKVLSWLGEKKMPAVLCVQKEFAEHMRAQPGSKSYSKLSVESALRFKTYMVREVPKTCFYPSPHVDSEIIYLIPKNVEIDKEADAVVGMLMGHKKKVLRKALIDSSRMIGFDKQKMAKIADSLPDAKIRPLHMQPEEILEVAKKVAEEIRA